MAFAAMEEVFSASRSQARQLLEEQERVGHRAPTPGDWLDDGPSATGRFAGRLTVFVKRARTCEPDSQTSSPVGPESPAAAPVPHLRRSVRAVILDEKDCVLLCRFDLSAKGAVLWATPGGGMEDGESPMTALRRELDEEVGLALIAEPPHVWHQRVVAEGHAQGYDGVINDYYLVNVDNFVPSGSLGAEMLRAENITGFRWWSLSELQAYRGHAIFAPRDLAALLAKLIRKD